MKLTKNYVLFFSVFCAWNGIITAMEQKIIWTNELGIPVPHNIKPNEYPDFIYRQTVPACIRLLKNAEEKNDLQSKEKITNFLTHEMTTGLQNIEKSVLDYYDVLRHKDSNQNVSLATKGQTLLQNLRISSYLLQPIKPNENYNQQLQDIFHGIDMLPDKKHAEDFIEQAESMAYELRRMFEKFTQTNKLHSDAPSATVKPTAPTSTTVQDDNAFRTSKIFVDFDDMRLFNNLYASTTKRMLLSKAVDFVFSAFQQFALPLQTKQEAFQDASQIVTSMEIHAEEVFYALIYLKHYIPYIITQNEEVSFAELFLAAIDIAQKYSKDVRFSLNSLATLLPSRNGAVLLHLEWDMIKQFNYNINPLTLLGATQNTKIRMLDGKFRKIGDALEQLAIVSDGYLKQGHHALLLPLPDSDSGQPSE